MFTSFLYMIAELSAISQIINLLTSLDPLPALIVEVLVTTIYTGKSSRCLKIPRPMLTRKSATGGFRISFITDNVQGGMVLLLIVICTIAIGTKTSIDPSLIGPSGLTQGSALGWKLVYILPV